MRVRPEVRQHANVVIGVSSKAMTQLSCSTQSAIGPERSRRVPDGPRLFVWLSCMDIGDFSNFSDKRDSAHELGGL
eukprot:11445507-Heterocapsa_arctica.AAC.1